jgi:hypothetical protein
MAKTARDNLLQIKTETHNRLNNHKIDKKFKANDIVFVLDRYNIPGNTRPLKTKFYSSPCVVLQTYYTTTLIQRISDGFKALYSNDHLKKYTGGDPLFQSLPTEIANILLHDFNDLLSSDLTTIIKFDPMYLPTGMNLKDTVEWQISRDNDHNTMDNTISRETIPLSFTDQNHVDPIDQQIDPELDSVDPIEQLINNINNHVDSVGDHSKPSPPYLREGRIAKTSRNNKNKQTNKTRQKNKKNMQLLPDDVFSPDSPTDPSHDQESKGLDELTSTDHRDQEQGGLLQTTTHSATTDQNQERNSPTQANSHVDAAPSPRTPVRLEESSSEDENENEENDENVKILRSGKRVRFA